MTDTKDTGSGPVDTKAGGDAKRPAPGAVSRVVDFNVKTGIPAPPPRDFMVLEDDEPVDDVIQILEDALVLARRGVIRELALAWAGTRGVMGHEHTVHERIPEIITELGLITRCMQDQLMSEDFDNDIQAG